jgi:hypothetical protein
MTWYWVKWWRIALQDPGDRGPYVIHDQGGEWRRVFGPLWWRMRGNR